VLFEEEEVVRCFLVGGGVITEDDFGWGGGFMCVL